MITLHAAVCMMCSLLSHSNYIIFYDEVMDDATNNNYYYYYGLRIKNTQHIKKYIYKIKYVHYKIIIISMNIINK